MKGNVFSWMARIIAVSALTVATGALAQAPIPEHLSGNISDYTPSIPSTKPNTPPTPPYEMRGHWSLHLKERSGKADFSAEMAMEFSDYWLLTSNADPTNSDLRGQHTHHITMRDAMVTYDTSVCPLNSPATNGSGLVLTSVTNVSVVKITGNGSPAPFESKGPSSLQVCITGGAEVPLSNMSLVFGGPATGHFGSKAIHGVVRFPHKSDKDREDEAQR